MKKNFILNFMVALIAITLTTTGLLSCNKEAPLPDIPTTLQNDADKREQLVADYKAKYSVTDAVVEEPAYDEVKAAILNLGIWPENVIDRTLCTPMAMDEKLSILMPYVPERLLPEANLETIARKTSGNTSVNGSAAYWDCNLTILAQTIAEIGLPATGVNNYYNAGTSATTITMSDVLRAVNGVNNTSFNAVIELIDVVFEFQVSADNWLVGAVLTVNGTVMRLFSTYTVNPMNLDEDPTNDVPELGPLVYDPVNGGANLVGPIEGTVNGVVSMDVTGVWEPEIVE